VIVTCERCATQFQLDDAKVPDNGFRARCSRCEHSFTVESPRKRDADRAAELARDALSKPPEEPAGIEAEVESDWGFNDDASAEPSSDPIGELDDDLAAGAIEEFDDGIGADAIESLDDGVDADAIGEFDDGLAADAIEPLDDGIGVDPIDELDEEFDAESSSSPVAAFEDSVIAESTPNPIKADDSIDADDVGPKTAEQAVDNLLVGFESPVSEVDPSSADSELEGGDPLAGLDSWDAESLDDDFDEFGLDALGAEPSAAERSTAPRLESSPVVPRRRSPEPVPAVDAATETPREPRFGSTLGVDHEPSEASLRLARVGEVFGWVFVVLLLITGLHAGLSGRQPTPASLGQWTGGGFELDRIAGRWVENAVAGPVYVVSGQIRRASGTRSDLSTQLELRLIDSAGRTLDATPVVVGPKLPERILRESDPSRIQALQAQQAPTFAAAAAAWLPFEAVVVEMPEAAARFELEVVAVERDSRFDPATSPVG
jgi:predicted Zn finger-like uncharacterized protein